MARAVVQISLFGLLLALVTTLPNKDDWDIYSFHINSTVSSRYATTVITSRVANRMEESKEIEFHVRIPKNAFITKFRMFIDGEPYDGVVKAKEAAKEQYAHAVSLGQSAGIVSSVGRTLEEFKTSVNVAAHKKVTFELTYEELLKRRLGKYELQIHARPMQPVKDFKVDVHINEKSGINFMEVKGGLSTNALANAITKTLADTQAWVYFYPTEDQQKACDGCGDQGMNGDLVIVYDVNRDSSLGDIKRSSGYFVHHFAPSNLPRIPKNVVFVIDQSGSMHGRKMHQTRIALLHILNDLAKEDFFGLITFDSSIFHWKRELLQANEQNLASAKAFAREIRDRGATDINAAVLEGARMLNVNPREGSASILILLTDGDPTSGVTDIKVIQSNVRKAIAGKFPLYCLGFGFDVNFEFLEKMSLQNNGVARRIYEDSDADLQLKGFYEEVATPLLTDVIMIYEGGVNLTQTNFSQYYNGSEIVVAGQISDNDIETFTPQVVAISRNTRVVFSNTNATVEATGTVSDSHIQRVWAYLTVKQLLEKELQLSGPERESAKKEALELSLKYSFVTPLTSMVVTKPPGESTDVLHKPQEGEILPPPQSPPQIQSRFHLGTLDLPNHGFAGQYPAKRRKKPAGKSGFVSVQGNFPAHARSDLDFDVFDQTGRTQAPPPPNLIPPRPRPATTTTEYETAGAYYDMYIPQPTTTVTEGPTIDHIAHRTLHTGAFSPPALPALPPPLHAVPLLPLAHKFLLKTENQSLPLCFDIFGDVHLKLLHHPSRELSVNGELDSVAYGGFKRIVIHVAHHDITVETQLIVVREGQNVSVYIEKDKVITVGSATVIRRDREIDVAVGDMRMVFLIHGKNFNQFLWPVMRQMPTDTNVTGLLALKPAVYEEVQQSPPKLMIDNKEIDVARHQGVDYSIATALILDCWLMTAESALQRPLNEFIVADL